MSNVHRRPLTVSSVVEDIAVGVGVAGGRGLRRRVRYGVWCVIMGPRYLATLHTKGFDNIYSLKAICNDEADLEDLGIDQMIPRRRIFKHLQVGHQHHACSLTSPGHEVSSSSTAG
jgi:hypothetical protein